jgi:3-oxoacyl-[acyl-carrier protein] reductase
VSAEVALVTGASRGIGKVIAHALVAAGARVALNARSRPELQEAPSDIQESGGGVQAIAADVSEPAAVDQLVAETEATLGPITLLVNNAGVLGPVSLVWEVDPVEWWHCVEINLRGPFLCTRAVLPGMLSRRDGPIVSLVSGAATGPIPDGIAYGTQGRGWSASPRVCQSRLKNRA